MSEPGERRDGASQSVLVLSGAEIARLLPMAECVALMGEALGALARGAAVLPERLGMWTPDRSGLLLLMPGALASPVGAADSADSAVRADIADSAAVSAATSTHVADSAALTGSTPPVSAVTPADVADSAAAPTSSALAVKVVTLFAGNAGTPYPAVQGAVLLFDPATGALLAILDANAITALRTAAVSGLATKLLARENAGDLAILGSGVQARSHLAAMCAVRSLRRVRVWSRNPDHARKFAERESARHGIDVEPVESPGAALVGADLVCAVTSAREPVVEGVALASGAHVNAVGVTGDSTTRELDTAAVAGAQVFVDSRAAALIEAGELLVPMREGAITEAHILAELGEVALGRHPGRRDRDAITVFKSLGLAIEDVAAAHALYTRALTAGVGTRIILGDDAEA